MLVFIDESGDAGPDVAGGASPIFVVAMVVFADAAAAAATQRAIEGIDPSRKRREYKFSKCRPEARDRFFAAVCNCDFTMRAIVVRKGRAPATSTERSHQFFVESLVRRSEYALADARVTIDGIGPKDFRRSVETALRQRIRPGAVQRVRFKDSKADVLIQLADMCAGAIARAFRVDDKRDNRWLKMLQPRIIAAEAIWEFRDSCDPEP
jgi:hypothetical protein